MIKEYKKVINLIETYSKTCTLTDFSQSDMDQIHKHIQKLISLETSLNGLIEKIELNDSSYIDSLVKIRTILLSMRKILDKINKKLIKIFKDYPD